MTHKEIYDRAVEVSRGYHRSQSRLIDVLQLLDVRKTYREYGCTSLYQFAVQDLKLSEDTAYSFITVARKAVTVPALKAEIALGTITVSKARRMCSVITRHNYDRWLELAKCSSVRVLEKEVARVNPKAAVSERASYVTAERMLLQLGVSESLMKKFRRVQDLECQSKQKHIDLEATLEAALDLFLERKDPVKKAERINAARPVPGRVEHAVNLRDQGKCTECGDSRWVDHHHIIPRESGGPDTLENLTTLCRAHHAMLHRRSRVISLGEPSRTGGPQ